MFILSRRILMADRLILSVDSDDKKSKYNLYESSIPNPEIFVDGIQGMMVAGSVAKFNFFTQDYLSPEETKGGDRRRLACRLVMSVETFLSTADYFQRYAKELREKIQQQQTQQKNPN